MSGKGGSRGNSVPSIAQGGRVGSERRPVAFYMRAGYDLLIYADDDDCLTRGAAPKKFGCWGERQAACKCGRLRGFGAGRNSATIGRNGLNVIGRKNTENYGGREDSDPGPFLVSWQLKERPLGEKGRPEETTDKIHITI